MNMFMLRIKPTIDRKTLTIASGFSRFKNSATILSLYSVNHGVPVYVSPAFKYSTGVPPFAALSRYSFNLLRAGVKFFSMIISSDKQHAQFKNQQLSEHTKHTTHTTHLLATRAKPP